MTKLNYDTPSVWRANGQESLLIARKCVRGYSLLSKYKLRTNPPYINLAFILDMINITEWDACVKKEWKMLVCHNQ